MGRITKEVSVVGLNAGERLEHEGAARPREALRPIRAELNFNPHTHLAAIDGVYSFDAATGAPTFHFIDPPTKQELTELVHQLSRRVAKMLDRRGLIRDGPVQAAADENEQAALDACRGVSLRRARFERIDDKGQSQQTPKSKHADKAANESLSTSSTVPDEHDGTFDVMATKPSLQDRDLAPRPSERPPSKIATLGHPIPPGLRSRSRP